ncbi:ferritin family protein [Candidatus Bipolaricaulota bacterium]|nr:ferritin family protein [Candidatus Bipolaricaulota bacterium]
MDNQEDILKGAILLERRGKAFYEGAIQATPNEAVREVFAILAGEEGRHIEILSKLYADLVRTGRFAPAAPADGPADIAGSVLNDAVRNEISAAGYEAAAIYAGMALEERSVAFYTEQANRATGEAQKLYRWLADWERAHLDLLAALDDDLRRRVWHDRRFWPVL